MTIAALVRLPFAYADDLVRLRLRSLFDVLARCEMCTANDGHFAATSRVFVSKHGASRGGCSAAKRMGYLHMSMPALV